MFGPINRLNLRVWAPEVVGRLPFCELDLVLLKIFILGNQCFRTYNQYLRMKLIKE